MKLSVANRLTSLRPKERAAIGRFLADRKLRGKVAKAMQAQGIGLDISPDDVGKWLELILKFLPIFLQIIALL